MRRGGGRGGELTLLTATAVPVTPLSARRLLQGRRCGRRSLPGFCLSVPARRFSRRPSGARAFPRLLEGGSSRIWTADFYSCRQRQLPNLPQDFPEPAADSAGDLDRQFQESWRDEMLARAWKSLADAEKLTGQPFHTVLRFRADHPELRSPELARQLAETMQRPLTKPRDVRQACCTGRGRNSPTCSSNRCSLPCPAMTPTN